MTVALCKMNIKEQGNQNNGLKAHGGNHYE